MQHNQLEMNNQIEEKFIPEIKQKKEKSFKKIEDDSCDCDNCDCLHHEDCDCDDCDCCC